MKRVIKVILKVMLIILSAAAICAIAFFCTLLGISAHDKSYYGQQQKAYIAQLEDTYANDYNAADEKTLTGFDVQASENQDARLNALQFLGTHNSYKQSANAFAKGIMHYILAPLHFAGGEEWSYSFDTLTQQLNNGIRSIELDVMREKEGFRCAHIPLIDYASSCPDFSLSLKEISLWSQNHPNHLPVTILLEPKSTFLSGAKLFHRFNTEDAMLLDTLLSQTLGDALYTPAQMLGDYGSFADLRADNAYPPVSGLLGKIIVIYHYDGEVIEQYANTKMFLSVFPRNYLKANSTDIRDSAIFTIRLLSKLAKV